ncbi:restriction endonuclease subunit S [Enterococcus faecium]|uniref:restriction endonuclease subunit S n=1 Tax=Enterococcus faecium TaxID=1352 RepID=UPI000F6552D2|nr:restriction endonuclease subunit S [Enterococcus faecium]RRQ57002.1 restriction endonuclease subunit S [Enterococcus faecium]
MSNDTQPEIRFPGFTDEWEQRKLGELATIVRGASPRPIQDPKWFDTESDVGWLRIADVTEQDGRIYYLEQHISKLGQEKTRVLVEPHLLLSIAATVGKPVVNYVKTGVHDGFLIFLNAIFDREFMFQWLEMFRPKWQKYGQPGSQVNLNSELVRNQEILIPNNEEQQKIGSFFKQLDDTIALHQRKLDLLKETKKGFLQKMFPKNGAKVPEIRFPGFTEDWEERKLNEGMTEYTDRVYIQDDEIYKQVSVKNVGEITLRGEQIGSKIGRKRQAKVNLIEHPDTLIFTRQTIEQGGIGFAPKETDGAIVTENMPTIDVDNDIINCNYLLAYVKTEDWYRKVILKNIEGGTAQIAIHEDSILSSEVLIPKIEEQQKIGTFFKQIDDTIALHQSKLDLLKETKKGFLQKMFV